MRLFIACAALLLGGAVRLDAQVAAVPPCSAAGEDRDEDGLADACEHALASAFAPLLTVRAGSCNWDTTTRPARHGGGYFHAVQPVRDAGGERTPDTVRIAYMPAYFHDCSWSGFKCVLPFVDCTPHEGDSEIIVVEVIRAGRPDEWRAARVFLSAHCFTRSAPSCRWYDAAEDGRFQWSGGSPVVWVAEGRHANYPDWRACNRGHRRVDTCDRHDTRFFFPIYPQRNIGSRTHPAAAGGCVRGRELGSAAVAADAEECFWRADMPFRGWQSAGPGVTPYERYLREIAGM